MTKEVYLGPQLVGTVHHGWAMAAESVKQLLRVRNEERWMEKPGSLAHPTAGTKVHGVVGEERGAPFFS